METEIKTKAEQRFSRLSQPSIIQRARTFINNLFKNPDERILEQVIDAMHAELDGKELERARNVTPSNYTPIKPLPGPRKR